MINSLARILERRLSHGVVLLLEHKSDSVSDICVDIRRGIKEFSGSTDYNVMGLVFTFPVVRNGEHKRCKDWQDNGGEGEEVDHYD